MGGKKQARKREWILEKSEREAANTKKQYLSAKLWKILMSPMVNAGWKVEGGKGYFGALRLHKSTDLQHISNQISKTNYVPLSHKK